MSNHLQRRSLLPVLAALAACWMLATVAGCGDGGGGPTASASPDAVVLLVNGQPLRRSAIDAVRAEFRLGGSSDSEARARKEAVARELVRQEAGRRGVAADPAGVRARRAAMAGELGGEAALKAALERVPMSEAQLQRNLEDGVLREALQTAKYPRLAATRAVARTYYERHRKLFRQPGTIHLGVIQVPAERIAESALARLREGRPFEEVARQFSTDPEAKAKGGDMGWVATSSLPAPLRKAAAAIRPGGVSKPVAGPGGWFVLKVMAERPAGVTPFAAVEADLRKELTRRQRFAALQKWLALARDKAILTQP